ncbi:2-hydroxychromene-2-carboxylate isomerase [Chthonobacter rhizosphaerae]|uniref:2-hydroxychromene-2-carboxylate isomerase n=1 Tax=Chthonobacter rhizosphaerae TaxID=2735553 RepID=UPI0015EE82C1|nr:2-hydroxychromene-2-carboxylate isomerase [Chthonobacter rhizosphaerae]
MTSTDIEFWFDFSSGYAYFAALDVEALGRRVGRRIRWRPFMLGTAFKVTGARGLSSTPMKSDYARRDWERIAREKGVPFAPPDEHPKVALAATRAFYWIEAQDRARAATFAASIFHAYYAGALDTSSTEAIAAHAAVTVDADPLDLKAGIADPALKDAVRATSEEAVARGVFGSPFFFADGEPFWGWDRMAMMERWLETGGW